jgi:hypothetical protein
LFLFFIFASVSLINYPLKMKKNVTFSFSFSLLSPN